MMSTLGDGTRASKAWSSPVLLTELDLLFRPTPCATSFRSALPALLQLLFIDGEQRAQLGQA